MLKLLNVDAPGERALRVVAYFDQLASHRPDPAALVRAAATIADCPAGLRLPPGTGCLRYNEDGSAIRDGSPAVRSSELAFGPVGEQAMVWLEREGPAGELDDFILERMALVVESIWQRRSGPDTALEAVGLSDPALAQLLVNERANEAERSRAASLLGLSQAAHLRLVALTGNFYEQTELQRLSQRLSAAWGRRIHLAQMSHTLALAIVPGRVPVAWSDELFSGRGAIGPLNETLDAPQSWNEARAALRLAGTGFVWPRLLFSEDVGALRLSMMLDASTVLENSDVKKIGRLAAGEHGTETLRILDYVVHTESLRAAAREANFHHSSLQAKVDRIERCLQYNIRSGAGRDRASFALMLWNLYGPTS